jgi:anti-sigma regulatory factor (Ser/Thr protein kinase)
MESRRPVQLTAPAERSSVRLARLVASGVGADAGLSVDDTEDLRIAVSELVALLVDGNDDPDLTVAITYRTRPGEVSVEGEKRGGQGADANRAVDDLALEILRVVVDDHGFEADATGRRFHLVKRARSRT